MAGGAAPSVLWREMGQTQHAGVEQSQLGRWGSPPDGEAPGPAARKSQGTGSRSGPQAQGPGVGVPESSQYYRKVQRDMATLERPPQGWEAGAHGRPGRWPSGLEELGQTQEGP